MKNKYELTVRVCGMSYIVQGILNNFLPLLFLRFSYEFGISLDKISFLIIVNFGIQMIVDFLSAKWVDFFGYRKSAVFGQLLSFLGLVGLSFLPNIFSNSFAGILVCVFIYGIGSGLIETVSSPIVEACPIDNKAARMSMLHSNYCWGHVLVAVVSSTFFSLFGIHNWRILACLWAIIPFVIMFLFMKVPMCSLLDQSDKIIGGKEFIKMPVFWMLIVLMFCSGASEQGISQWISTFAEAGLSINKTTGDLVGTCMFAVLMGSSRVLYGKWGHRINLNKFMIISGGLCFLCYLFAAISSYAVVSLISSILCGLTVGIMWPGIYSVSTKVIKCGGTGLFAYLALAGDMGCAGGPGLLGIVSGLFSGNLKTGILFTSVFPALFVIMLLVLERGKNKR